jgi:hypothetical protein
MTETLPFEFSQNPTVFLEWGQSIMHEKRTIAGQHTKHEQKFVCQPGLQLAGIVNVLSALYATICVNT